MLFARHSRLRTTTVRWLLAVSVVGCDGSPPESGFITPDAGPADVFVAVSADVSAAPPVEASVTDASDSGTDDVLPADSGTDPDAMLDAANEGCVDDDGCPAGALCASGACVPGCTSAHGCAGSNVCCAAQCRDPRSDPSNCGACDQACSNANVPAPACVAGACTGACVSGFADCDHSLLTDGCETNVQVDVANCGSCGAACSSTHVTSVSCDAGACTGACAAGWMDCNGQFSTDGCGTNVQSDPKNCGACAAQCSGNHVPTPACSDGGCAGACAAGWADCNGSLQADGCEQNIATNSANCGGCGAACANTCAAGSCVCRLGLPDAPVLHTVSAPAAVASADFNGDGRPDLAEVSMQPASGGGYAVRVFLNQGGAYFTYTDYTTDAGGIAILAADINGDGYPDIATAEFDAQSVDVLINNGHGGFGTATKYANIADQPVALALVNGEVVVVDQYSNDLKTLGGGTVATTPSEPVAIAAGDVDGDGIQDMAVVNVGNSTVSVFSSRNRGARTDYPTSAGPLSVAIADLNGDGAPDLLVGEGGAYDVRVFLNSGTGQFSTSTTYPTVGSGGRPTCLAVADFNGDGHLDVATANNFAGNSLTVFLNQGNGTLGVGTAYETGNDPPDGAGLAVGDFQGRGHADIATASGSISAVYLFLGEGTGQFLRPPTVPTGAGSIAVAIGDLNGDGAPDLVGANYDGESVSVILSAGGRTFQARTDYGLQNQPYAVAVADLNGDGHLDIVVGDAAPGDVAVLLNHGNGTFAAAVHYQPASSTGAVMTGVATGDIDGDGDTDIVAADNALGNLVVYYNDGAGGFASQATVSTGTGSEPSGVALVDVNGDQQLDLAVSASSFVVLLNQGGGTFGSPTTYASDGYMQAIATGDLDGDGRMDLVGVGGNSGFVDVLLNGAAGFSSAASYPITELPANILVSDIDGDGQPDVVAASQNDDSGVVSVLLNTGGGVLAPRLDYSTPLGASGIAARDLDGDGHTDVVATVDYNGGSGMYLLYGGCL